MLYKFYEFLSEIVRLDLKKFLNKTFPIKDLIRKDTR